MVTCVLGFWQVPFGSCCQRQLLFVDGTFLFPASLEGRYVPERIRPHYDTKSRGGTGTVLSLIGSRVSDQLDIISM